MDETGIPQTGLMHRQAVGAHHVLKGSAFLADLQLAVAIGPLEVEMQIDEQLVDRFIFEAELFRIRIPPGRRPS